MLKIAFAGNPNVGKTALINEIAGSKLKVGNWPGVTVEKKEAQFTYENEEIFLIDLPGVYSLSPYSNDSPNSLNLRCSQVIPLKHTICNFYKSSILNTLYPS